MLLVTKSMIDVSIFFISNVLDNLMRSRDSVTVGSKIKSKVYPRVCSETSEDKKTDRHNENAVILVLQLRPNINSV